ncbi:nucleoside-diphosphate sugar epimerase [Pedobacter yulinensis]|uniref:Nucleoside-diphosphate sugar epimerase n=1 Tax=Pedobacter yulinensis TaxID=2126353 RepID=A0A2T3HQM0_9SPHI|nr:SDR family NAD(P)-dependent oxidoreductase [Pedobacter yulinensis]PST84754.1 nucleoside-diphosphate sugar epimerase [Pedobacter yulinensis]
MILVTGATGFLGAEVVYQLTKQGLTVRATRRESSKIPALLQDNNLVDWQLADLNDVADLQQIFEGITRVYHCAALVSFSPADKENLYRTNIEGTANIVNACLLSGARLVHVSSVAALGNARRGATLITEDDHREYDPKAHAYGVSKYEGEMEVWRGINEGLDAVIVNPSVIIGVNAGFTGSGAIFKMVKDGFPYYTRGVSGFVDVADVARVMIRLMDSPVSGERFIVSSENYSYKDLLTLAAKEMGLKAPAREAKPWMLGLAWRFAKIFSLLTGKAAALTKDTAKSSLEVSKYSNQKVVQTTAIQFKPVADSLAQIGQALR